MKAFKPKYYWIFLLTLSAKMICIGQNQVYFIADITGNNNIFTGFIHNDEIVGLNQITFYTNNDYVAAYDVCKITGRIIFIVTQDGRRGDLFLIDDSNCAPTLIPNQPATRIGPMVHWSPDGSKLLFSLGAEQHYVNLEIATMKLDGSEFEIVIPTNIPINPACHKSTIHWLPEGMYLGIVKQWVAYATDHDLWFRDNYGTLSKITNTSTVGERYAFLASDGHTLVFQTLDNQGRQGMRHMPKEGGTQTEILAHNTQHHIIPHGWLSDNTVLYSYRLNVQSEKWDVYLIEKNGANPRNISNMAQHNIYNALIADGIICTNALEVNPTFFDLIMCTNMTIENSFEIINNDPNNNLTFSFSNQPVWINFNPVSGNVPAQQSIEISATINTNGLTPGTYAQNIQINNSSVINPFLLPITVQTIPQTSSLFIDQDNENNELTGTPDGDFHTYLCKGDPRLPIEFNFFIEQPIVMNAELKITAFDVDATPAFGIPYPEVNEVYVNGNFVGILTGADETESISVFNVPGAFLIPGPNGKNLVQIFVSTKGKYWCLEMRGAELNIIHCN